MFPTDGRTVVGLFPLVEALLAAARPVPESNIWPVKPRSVSKIPVPDRISPNGHGPQMGLGANDTPVHVRCSHRRSKMVHMQELDRAVDTRGNNLSAVEVDHGDGLARAARVLDLVLAGSKRLVVTVVVCVGRYPPIPEIRNFSRANDATQPGQARRRIADVVEVVRVGQTFAKPLPANPATNFFFGAKRKYPTCRLRRPDGRDAGCPPGNRIFTTAQASGSALHVLTTTDQHAPGLLLERVRKARGRASPVRG